MGLRGRGKELGQGRGVKDWARADWSGGVGPGELLVPRRRNWAAGMGWAGAGLSLVLGSFSIPSSLLFLIKQSLNSNTNLNSNHTQIFKTMHQHECNNTF